jgi:hypothetical protein
LREEHRLRVLENRVLENRVLKEIFGPKRAEVTGEWRKLHNEALYHLYPTPNIIRVIDRMGWVGHVARMGERRCVYRILLVKPRRRWEVINGSSISEMGRPVSD